MPLKLLSVYSLIRLFPPSSTMSLWNCLQNAVLLQ